MKISIFGMGYVGAVSAACLSSDGHTVIGVDPNPTKVDLINQGLAPVIEKDLEALLVTGVTSGRLEATSDAEYAVTNTTISFISVGTPSQANGNLDLSFVERVCQDIGSVLRNKDDFHVIVIRSTILPGSMRDVVIPTLEKISGKKAGANFGVCNNPEFLREGTAIYDYYNPPKTVIGEIGTTSGELLARLYSDLSAPLIRTDIETAEMVKYTDNVWHAVKVGFANEIGNLCKAIRLDGQDVMDIFCQDTKLNLSSYYMKPGFAFGGSCLPKDIRALNYKAKSLDLELPIIGNILTNNAKQIDRGVAMITDKGNKKVSILGISFKVGTDDLRESPLVEVVERLIGKGYELCLYDKSVNLARLTGANKDYIINAIPHISSLMVETLDEAISHGQTIVIGNGANEFKNIMAMTNEEQVIVDLVGIVNHRSIAGRYDGICW
jgi:GDP-mannose 6-dehydrogenase